MWQVQESVSTKVLLVHSLRRKKGMYFVTPDDTPIHVEPQPFAKQQPEQKSVREERRRRAEAERLAKEAAQKRDEEEEALRKKEEEARKKAEQAAAARNRREEEEAARKKAEHEAAQKKAQEEEEARKKEKEEAARTKNEEAEAARRKVVEEEARTWAEEERERKAAEDRQAAEAALKKAEEEAQREERKRVAAEAEAQKKAEEETRRRKEEEEAAARKKKEKEAAAQQKQEEEETRMKEQDEAAARRKKEEEEAARKKTDEEVQARKNKKVEEARKEGLADAAQKRTEEEPAGNGTRKAPKNGIVPKLSSPQGLARWSEHQHVAPSPYARGREQEGAARDQRRGGGTRVFAVGQRVLAKFENSDEFFDGVIDSINRNGTFVVAFDDGDFDRSVPRQNIVHPAAAVVSRDGEEPEDLKPIEHMSGSVGGAFVFSGGRGGGGGAILKSDSEIEQLVLGYSAALALQSSTSSCGDDMRSTMSTNDASWDTSHASTTSAEQVVVAKRALSFALGQRVLARFEGSEEFFDGFIAALNDDGTFGSPHPFAPIGLGCNC
jgi:hypothetical protein